MSLRIRQIVFAARNLAATVAQFETVLGLQVAYRDPGVGEFGLENAVMPIGDQFLEVVSPTRGGTPASRHLERHSDSSYMLIFQTDDLARERARFERLGVRLVWQSEYPDIRSVHLHPKDIGAAIVSLDEATPPESWRWAGPDWRNYVGRCGAQHVREVSIGAIDAAGMANRWATVLGTEAPSKSNGTPRIPIESGALTFHPNASDIISAYDLVVTDVPTALASAHARGLPVADDVVTICGTRFRLLSP
jgi:Glyoxalase-like domain